MQGSEPDRSFEALWRDSWQGVWQFVFRRCGDPQIASDVTAETFLVAWRRRREVPTPSRAWLYGVARKVLANQVRANHRQVALVAKLSDQERPLSSSGAASELGEVVVRAFNALDPADRQVLALVIWDELSPPEAAQALGIRDVTFRVRFHRAKARLRNKIDTTGHI